MRSIENKSYDIILMDLQMPVMGGVEATNIIRKELGCEIPVIALTAAALKEDKDKALECGMNDYIVKPINAVKLREKLEQWGTYKYQNRNLSSRP